MNRIKVVSDPAELVPILRSVDTVVKKQVFDELTTEWRTENQIKETYGEAGVDALRFFEKVKMVETKWQTGEGNAPVKAYHAFYTSFHINATSPVQEISDVLHVAMMTEADYAPIESELFEIVGEEGKFAGDIADKLELSQTKLKSLVKRSHRLDYRGHRIMRFKD